MNDDIDYETVDPILGIVKFSIEDDTIGIRCTDGILGDGFYAIAFHAKEHGWDDIASKDDLRDRAERWLVDVKKRAGIAIEAREIVIKSNIRGVKQ
jgi:hypothetical protein